MFQVLVFGIFMPSHTFGAKHLLGALPRDLHPDDIKALRQASRLHHREVRLPDLSQDERNTIYNLGLQKSPVGDNRTFVFVNDQELESAIAITAPFRVQDICEKEERFQFSGLTSRESQWIFEIVPIPKEEEKEPWMTNKDFFAINGSPKRIIVRKGMLTILVSTDIDYPEVIPDRDNPGQMVFRLPAQPIHIGGTALIRF